MGSILRVAQHQPQAVRPNGIDTAELLLNWMGIETAEPDLADTSISISLGRLSSAFILPFLMVAPFLPMIIPFMFTTLCK